MVPLDYLNELRRIEIDRIASWLKPGARVLELGAGTGQQSLELSRRGFDVVAIDLAGSTYAGARVFPIADYDGKRIPFADASFDIVYSSNMLEHVRDLAALHAEIRRILKPGGRCVHVLPTHFWRFWTIMASYPAALAATRHGLNRAIRQAAAALLQPRHGERGTGWSELWLFRPAWWRRNFRQNGFVVLREAPVGLFYTGHALRGLGLSFEARAGMARWLGSATHAFELNDGRA